MPDRIERLSLLAQALIASPRWPEIAKLMVLRVFEAWGCLGALIFQPTTNGSLTLETAYGYPDDQVAALRLLPPDSEPPVQRALRSDDPVWFPDPEDMAELGGAVPLAIDGSASMIVLPITRLGIPERVLVLSFSEPLPSNPASGPFVSAVKSLLELHGGNGNGDGRARAVAVEAREARPTSAQDVDLTSRQQRILELLALGKTNRWIAADLGFSESTVRQETLRLYRALGVNSRTDSVMVARSIGLIATDSEAESGAAR